MDANSAIGNVDYFIIKSTDNLGEVYETTPNKKFIPNQEATYSQVDTAMKALVTLSTNTYTDTICVTNISVNEVLAG